MHAHRCRGERIRNRDFFRRRFERNRGLRIAFVLGSGSLANRVANAFIDTDERDPEQGEGSPADHAPVVVDLEDWQRPHSSGTKGTVRPSTTSQAATPASTTGDLVRLRSHGCAAIGMAAVLLAAAGCTSTQSSTSASSTSTGSASVQISEQTFTVTLAGVATLSGYVSYAATDPRSVTLSAESPATPDVAGFTPAGQGAGVTFSGTPLGTPVTFDFPVGPAPQGAIPVVAGLQPDGGYQVEPATASSDGITFQTRDLTSTWPGWLVPAEYADPLIATFTGTLTATDPTAGCASHDSSWAMLTPDTSLLRTCLTTSGKKAHIELITNPSVFTDLTYPGLANPRKLTVDSDHELMFQVLNQIDPMFGLTLPPGTTVSGDFARKSNPVDQRFDAQVTPAMEAMSDSYAFLTALGLPQDEAEWGVIWGDWTGCDLLPDQHSSSEEANQLRQFTDTKGLAAAVTCTVEKVAALADGGKAGAAATRMLGTIKTDFGTPATVTQTLNSAADKVQFAAYALQNVSMDDLGRAFARQTLSSFPKLGANDPTYVHLNLPGSQGQYLYDWSDTGGVAFVSPSTVLIPCVMAGWDETLVGDPNYVRCDSGSPPQFDPGKYPTPESCSMHAVNGATLTTTPQVLCSGGSLGLILLPKNPEASPWYATDWYDPVHNEKPSRPRLVQLAPGNSIRVDDHLCTALRGGVRCENTATGHGFELTATTYKFF